MSITVRHISKSFGPVEVLRDVSLEVPTGELVSLLGPSGSGKTTLLRIIAGLEHPDPGGTILFRDEDVARRPVGERRVGFVFQHYALFRHMTVFENVAFGLRVMPRRLRPSREEIAERVRRLLELVQLDGFAQRYPNQLSGGQRQRVALARALAVEPKVLLLDEPFGALDARVRVELRRWLRRLHDEIHVTSVFVTHDQEEALEVADRVVVMNKGRIEQVGSPQEVYDRPATPFVYDFMGTVNRFPARVDAGRAYIAPGEAVNVPAGAGTSYGEQIGYARPHEIEISREWTDGVAIPARVRTVHNAGPMARVQLEREEGGATVEVVLSRDQFDRLALQANERVYLTPRRLRLFPSEGGEPLEVAPVQALPESPLPLRLERA